jgi:hypothetical protein
MLWNTPFGLLDDDDNDDDDVDEDGMGWKDHMRDDER